MPDQRSPLLIAPIVPTLVRLAAPGIVLALFQTAVSVGDTYFIGRLGTEALAGLALVFPMLMLLQMTFAGAMGGALVMQFGGPLWALFAVIALGLSTVGGLTGLVVFKARWTRS